MRKSSQLSILLIVLATVLLAFIGSISFNQIRQLRTSAELVAQTLRTETAINDLFAQYAMMQTTVFEKALQGFHGRQKHLGKHQTASAASVDTLLVLTKGDSLQKEYLEEVKKEARELEIALRVFQEDDIPKQPAVITQVTQSMQRLLALKYKMLARADGNLETQQKAYRESIFFTPLMTLFLGIFALCTFIVSFVSINRERKETLQSQSFLQNVLKSSPNLVSHFTPVKDAEGKIIDFKFEFTSQQYEELAGVEPAQVIGENLCEIYPANHENGLLQAMVACLKSGQTQIHEYEYELNGKPVWMENTINKLGKGVSTTARDCTPEKRAAEQMKKLNAKLQAQNLALLDGRAFLNNILKSTTNVIMHLESIRDEDDEIQDFRFLFVNNAIHEVTGDMPEELRTKKASDMFPTIFTNGVFEKLVHCVKQDEPQNYETVYQQNGETLYFSASAIKLNDGVIITTRDITDLKTREEALLQLNEELRLQNSILSEAEGLAKVGSYLWKTNNAEAQLSDNFYRILECEPQSFVATHQNYVQFLHEEDVEAYKDRWRRTLKTGKIEPYIYRIVTKKGRVKHLRTNGHFENRDDKKIVVGVVRDISEEIAKERQLKNKNKELQRSNEELESFNHVASHDLQEPLRKIQMFISRIPKEALEGRNAEFFEKINSAAHRMQTLIHYLLSYSRITKDTKDFTMVPLNKIVEDVLHDLEARIRESGVEVTVDEMPIISAIPFQMEQLFNNLISNALKYHSKNEPPRVVIDCKLLPNGEVPEGYEKQPKGYYRISVMDNGIGFDPRNSEKIFELFQRLHQKDEYSGTGIGLAICKKIAENHKGYIVAKGEPDKGATFCVYIPA